MKICFLSAANSIHTIRWVNAMADRGHDVHLISALSEKLDKSSNKVTLHKLPYIGPISYYLNARKVRKIIEKIKPDIVNAHYASGYGTLARLVTFTPTLLSVWGSDVFDFPYQSSVKRRILEKNLSAATQIASTSFVMKKQTEKFVKPELPIVVTPFGVDVNKFRRIKGNVYRDKIRIGMVKGLEEKYGPRYLIEATALLIDQLKKNGHKSILDKLQLVMVGGGNQLNELEVLVNKLGISPFVTFTGVIPHDRVPEMLNSFDIYCAPSTLSESFGVAVIEASSCELPVIVSNVGGLPEIVKDGETGYIVEPKNSEEIADRLYELLLDEQKRRQLGKSGRKLVLSRYEWEDNVSKMEAVYDELVSKYKINKG